MYRAEESVSQSRHDNEAPDPEQAEALRLYKADKPLSERLKVTRGEAFDPVPPQLIRKYIAYARKYVHPKLTGEAASVLQVREESNHTISKLTSLDKKNT